MEFTKAEKTWIIKEIVCNLDSYRMTGKDGLNFKGRFAEYDLPKKEREIMQSIAKKLGGKANGNKI